jgi:hypothetical protein
MGKYYLAITTISTTVITTVTTAITATVVILSTIVITIKVLIPHQNKIKNSLHGSETISVNPNNLTE